MSSTRLPDPPTSTSQVYAFMQRFRNFSSLSKNISKLTKKKPAKSPDTSTLSKSLHSPPQKYENTQFYVENNYQNVEIKANIKSKKLPIIRVPKKQPEDPYENTEFHQPPPVSPLPTLDTSQVTSSPKPADSLSITQVVTPTTASNIFTRKKSKSGKSFDSKFRKSLGPLTGGSSFATTFGKTRSTFYVSDSVDVDSGVFTSGGSTASPPPPPIPAPYIPTEHDTGDSATVPSESPRSSLQPTVNQRKSSLTIRPNNPPPPPPVEKRSSKSKRRNTTSWYTESGVFKLNALKDASQVDETAIAKIDAMRTELGTTTDAKIKEQSNNSSSWYADVGLYHTSGASVASSSGSSGVSTGGECGSGDDNSHSMFDNEPLYQIYSAAKLEVTNQSKLLDSK